MALPPSPSSTMSTSSTLSGCWASGVDTPSAPSPFQTPSLMVAAPIPMTHPALGGSARPRLSTHSNSSSGTRRAACRAPPLVTSRSGLTAQSA